MARMEELKAQYPETWDAGRQARLSGEADARPPEYLRRAGGDPSALDEYYAWIGGFAEAGQTT